MTQRLKMIFSVDVEEDGLFSGAYPRTPAGVSNVLELSRLSFITRDFKIPLTLLVTYPVVADKRCQEILRGYHENLGAEIGAHLHPWCTPPFEDLPVREPIPTRLLPEALLKKKIATLCRAIHDELGVVPFSFRMGRFDTCESLFSLLSECGLRVDGSVVPLRSAKGGPDHFLASPDPYWIKTGADEGNPLLEVPLTQVCPVQRLAGPLYRFSKSLSRTMGQALLTGFRYVGVLGIHPAWFPLCSMKRAVKIHQQRGGRVLHMFLHSSELMPCATPYFKSKAAIEVLLKKIREFLDWLMAPGSVEGVTLSSLLDWETEVPSG